MKLTNNGEYMVNVFGVILPPNDFLEGEACEATLIAHPELVNSIGCNGLTVDAEAAKLLGLKQDATPSAETHVSAVGGKPLDKMNKEELTAKARELNLDITEEDTKAVILKKIQDATPSA